MERVPDAFVASRIPSAGRSLINSIQIRDGGTRLFGGPGASATLVNKPGDEDPESSRQQAAYGDGHLVGLAQRERLVNRKG